ncbi:class I SAM-dependent methyltransferase [Allomuricauda sp. SCSIO 65647]|uniref:class I SAM-dependent methyltransferase n=1 Tax=Allomuricauda sp. SCSIO 65647 TaxID=2908843 RepID=UPI001F424B9A|nr:class I SAM-dependent methyltransferase [Muricauda sp. SCSIO 65647]UJH68615.1 class I SAM-dependent methyltransferase [Muricauda sp. SCSIO 65647]
MGGVLIIALVLATLFMVPASLQTWFGLAILLAVLNILASLFVSWYVYDYSNLYAFTWLDKVKLPKAVNIVNINAGFDETSALIKDKFTEAKLNVFDFYDPLKHTEVSIKRARKAYPPYPNTIAIQTTTIPLDTGALDIAFGLLSAHEIRNAKERSDFFKEVNRILQAEGKFVVVEHQRDLANLLAFGMGAFHFYSPKEWLQTFRSASFKITDSFKITPFVTAYILEKNGNTP